MSKITRLALLAAPIVLLSGCATVMDGTTQTLSFNLDPQEARCVLNRSGSGELGSVTGKSRQITVSKAKGDIIADCAAQGYLPASTRLVSSASGAGVASIFLFDFGITDLATGAYWVYPTLTSISLQRDPSIPLTITPAAYVPVPPPPPTYIAPVQSAAPTPRNPIECVGSICDLTR
jgi:hypothetical protein